MDVNYNKRQILNKSERGSCCRSFLRASGEQQPIAQVDRGAWNPAWLRRMFTQITLTHILWWLQKTLKKTQFPQRYRDQWVILFTKNNTGIPSCSRWLAISSDQKEPQWRQFRRPSVPKWKLASLLRVTLAESLLLFFFISFVLFSRFSF